MKTITSALFHDTADQLTQLAGVFQTPCHALRAQAIRKANKYLISLEAFFTPEFQQQASQWKKAGEALVVLEGRFKMANENHGKIELLNENIDGLQASMTRWRELSEPERNKIVQFARKAKQYGEQNLAKHEAHILHRFERFEALRALVPYSDNSEHLCDAIHHFENRQKYEDNIVRLEKKKEQARERLLSVRRGFFLACLLCAFIVTIPLCAPFAFSLWNRKREIENQIANFDETSRREEKRLLAADEGVVASLEIRDILGNVPLELVRRTLAEVKELRSEFQRPEKNAGLTAALLSFVELYKPRLEELFGEIPKGAVPSFSWLSRKVEDMLNIESQISVFSAELHSWQERQKKLLRGHSRGILQDSIENLRTVSVTGFDLPLHQDIKTEFALLCVQMPVVLSNVRQALGFVSHGQRVEDGAWQQLHRQLASLSNLLNATVLEMDLGQFWPAEEVVETQEIPAGAIK